VKEENLMYPSGIKLIFAPAKLGDVGLLQIAHPEKRRNWTWV
jgi:hypothetical protein